MGYELHIIRKNDYENDEEESSITLEEWLQYVADDAELQLTNGYQMNIPNIDISWKDVPGFTLWGAHPENKPMGSLWFNFWRGAISTKNPDEETIRKMLSIAEALNAKVQGDDNEYYDHSYFDNKSSLETGGSSTGFQTYSSKKPWWKFW